MEAVYGGGNAVCTWAESNMLVEGLLRATDTQDLNMSGSMSLLLVLANFLLADPYPL